MKFHISRFPLTRSRQEGRDFDNSVMTCEATTKSVSELLIKGQNLEWKSPKNKLIYGDGNAVFKIKNFIKNYFNYDRE